MAKLLPEVQETMGRLKALPLATASTEGKPNLNYVGYFRILDDETIQIADNKFFKTRQNLDANPVMAATCLDPENGACYQIKGSVELITEGPVYDDCVAWVHSSHPTLTPKAAVNLHIEEIYTGAKQLV